MGDFLTSTVSDYYFNPDYCYYHYYNPETMTYEICRRPTAEEERRIIESLKENINNTAVLNWIKTQPIKTGATYSEVTEKEWLALLED